MNKEDALSWFINSTEQEKGEFNHISNENNDSVAVISVENDSTQSTQDVYEWYTTEASADDKQYIEDNQDGFSIRQPCN